jgi:hypothetical protein
MPLPTNFSEWENLQNLIRLEHNKAVRNYFKNQPDDDVSTPKSRLKHSCLIKDDDTSTMTLIRLWLFEITIGHAQALQTPVYGMPVQEFQVDRKYKPQIKLYFKEPWDDEVHSDGTPQSRAEIGFRLMDESSETISRTKAETLAKAIKSTFAVPIFTWEKGWYKATYLDEEYGYDFRLLVKSKAEGERVIRQVLNIQNHAFNNDYFQYIDHERTYPINPGTHRVYGKQVKKFRQRPRVDVKFSYAQLLIWGRIRPVNLVAVNSRLQSVIERVPDFSSPVL